MRSKEYYELVEEVLKAHKEKETGNIDDAVIKKALELENRFNSFLRADEYYFEIEKFKDFVILRLYDTKYKIYKNIRMDNDYFLEQNISRNIFNMLDDIRKTRRLKEPQPGMSKTINKKSNTLLVDRIIFNGPATIVFWTDDTKTVVKCSDGDNYDPYTAVAYAYVKKIFGSHNQFKKMVDEFVPSEEEVFAWQDWSKNIKDLFLKSGIFVVDPYKNCRSCAFENVDEHDEPCDSCDLIDHKKRQEIISKKNVREIQEECRTKCVDCKHWKYLDDLRWECNLFGEMVCTVNKCIEFEPKEE